MMEHLTLYLLMAKDILEISLLSLICYRFLSWLKQDAKQPLLTSCYLYALSFAICFVLDLATLVHLLEISAPLFIILLVIMRQQRSPKDLIGSYKADINTESLWLEELTRFCLKEERNLIFLIEHTINIQDCLAIDVPVQTELTLPTIHYLTHCDSFKADHYILLNSKGNILGLNASWNQTMFEQSKEHYLEEALYHLDGTDACALYFHQNQRNFTLILSEKIYKSLSATQLLQSMQWYTNTDHLKKGSHHEQKTKTHQQQSPS